MKTAGFNRRRVFAAADVGSASGARCDDTKKPWDSLALRARDAFLFALVHTARNTSAKSEATCDQVNHRLTLESPAWPIASARVGSKYRVRSRWANAVGSIARPDGPPKTR